MSEVVSSEPAPNIPDNLTVPQFFFDSDHALRATRPHGVPFFIDDATGRAVDSREVSNAGGFISQIAMVLTFSRLANELTDSQMA
jgi:hypothetical protein